MPKQQLTTKWKKEISLFISLSQTLQIHIFSIFYLVCDVTACVGRFHVLQKTGAEKGGGRKRRINGRSRGRRDQEKGQLVSTSFFFFIEHIEIYCTYMYRYREKRKDPYQGYKKINSNHMMT